MDILNEWIAKCKLRLPPPNQKSIITTTMADEMTSTMAEEQPKLNTASPIKYKILTF